VVGLENKGFWIVFIPYIVLFIADITTTALNGSLLHLLELNPLYRLFGSLIPIIILNVVMIVVFYWMYHSKRFSPFNRYIVILLMMIVVVMRIVAIQNAMSWYETNMTITEIKEVYTPEVIQSAQIYYATLMYSPIIFCIVTFLLWYLDHKVDRKNRKKKKKIV